VFDSDSHEPPVLWENSLAPGYRPWASSRSGGRRVTLGNCLKVNRGMFRRGNPIYPPRTPAAGGLDPHVKHPAIKRAADPHGRFADTDAMGIDQALL